VDASKWTLGLVSQRRASSGSPILRSAKLRSCRTWYRRLDSLALSCVARRRDSVLLLMPRMLRKLFLGNTKGLAKLLELFKG
jgi:hypothetical protein